MREFPKTVMILAAGFAGLLALAGFLFPMAYDWDGGLGSWAADVTGQRQGPFNGNCFSDAVSAETRAKAEELPALDPSTQELLAKNDHELAPAEVLDLHDNLDQLDAIGKSPEGLAKAAAGVHNIAEQAAPEQEDAALPAPAHPTPAKLADLRAHDDVRFHWDAVRGATRYHVKAWQFWNNKQVMLLDAKTDDTEIKAEPRYPGHVYWQVAAVDAQGRAGPIAGPLTIEQLRSPERALASPPETKSAH